MRKSSISWTVLQKRSWNLLLAESYQDILCESMNAYDQKMFMARGGIADKGIWTAKKRYILNVHDMEGVRFKEPTLKIMGIEVSGHPCTVSRED